MMFQSIFLHSAVNRRDGIAMSQRFAGVANVEISFQIILSKSIRNQLLVVLLRSLHEVAQPQVAVGAGVVLHPLGLVVAGLHG